MRIIEILAEETHRADTEELFEMANLRHERTGVPGTIYISTAQGSHAPRVKHFAGRPSANAPSFSVSIEPDPKVVDVHDMSEREVYAVSSQVIGWVKINHAALTKFWFEGTSWFDEEVTAFKLSLKKLV